MMSNLLGRHWEYKNVTVSSLKELGLVRLKINTFLHKQKK